MNMHHNHTSMHKDSKIAVPKSACDPLMESIAVVDNGETQLLRNTHSSNTESHGYRLIYIERTAQNTDRAGRFLHRTDKRE